MASLQFSPIEKQMVNVDLDALMAQNETAKANIAAATSPADIVTEICGIWKKIRPFVIPFEPTPIIGKYITILAGLLDSICPKS